MNDNLLAFYMGYAFSHAVNIQHVLEPDALMVPYVVYWQAEQPTPVPYPAQTQQEAIKKANEARLQKRTKVTGWSSGREGLVTMNDGTKRDVLLIEGWVHGLVPPLHFYVCYTKKPFGLMQISGWGPHAQARKNIQAFNAEFKRGILAQPFGQQSMQYLNNAQPVQAVTG